MPRDDGFAMAWYVKVDDQVYGPYTAAQMRAFVGEGRVAGRSLVSEDRERGWRAASEVSQFSEWLSDLFQEPGRRRSAPLGARAANFVIIAQMEAEAAPAFEKALMEFGEVEPIAGGVWLLRGPSTAAVLRNELSHLLEREDKLLVVDASRDRTAWFNLGREADQRIRSLWGRPD